MGVPKRKVAHARQMDRRSHHALTLPTLIACTHCHEQKLPYRVRPNCGWYNGRLAVDLKPAGGSAGEENA
jgi:large subunit ribosomal protein L32